MSDETGPIIAVTHSNPDRARPYMEAVRRQGGAPWLVLAGPGVEAEEVLARADGLLLGGGPDLGPHWYGVQRHTATRDTDHERDALELELARLALERGVPVLGICRGFQVLNVAAGGRLDQDLPEGHRWEYCDGRMVSRYHRIFIAPGSRLAATVGSGGFVRVNSRHHQGVREAHKAPGLMASAYALEDGVIEGLESPEHPWALAVQFHPERVNEVPPHFQALFRALVERARDAGEGS